MGRENKKLKGDMMKKQKLIYVFLFIVSNFIIINTVLANSNNTSNSTSIQGTLTVEQATQRAIKNNNNIEAKKDSINLTIDSEKKLREIVITSDDPISRINATAQIMSSQMRRVLAIKDIDASEDNIRYCITSYFSSIISAQKSLELYDEFLKLQKKELLILKTKSELGLESKINYENKKNDYEINVNKRSIFISSIDSAYRALNNIIAEELDARYKLELELKFKKLDDIDLRYYTNLYTEQSSKVKYADNEVKIAQYKLDNYIDSVYDYTINQSRENPTSREELIQSLKESGRNSENLKDAVKNKVIESYNKIKDKEVDIEEKILKLQEDYNKLKILEIQLKLGKIISLEVDKFKYSLKEQEESLRKSKIDYILMVTEFENPNILLGNL